MSLLSEVAVVDPAAIGTAALGEAAPPDRLRRLQSRANALFSGLEARSALFEKIRAYLDPWHYSSDLASDPTDADENPVYDSTPAWALQTLQNGLVNGITSPARPWLFLGIAGDPEISQQNKQLLEDVERAMRSYLAFSNFYSSIALVYRAMAAYGTGAMLIYPDAETLFRCYPLPPGSFALAVDIRGRPHALARRFKLSLAALREEFGEVGLTDAEKRLLGRTGGFDQRIEVTHLIEPQGSAWVEYYWRADRMKLLARRRQREQPFVVARWDVQESQPFGIGPGITALPDIIGLQVLAERKFQAMEYFLNPPLLVEGSVAFDPRNLLPGRHIPMTPGMNFGAKPIYTVTPPVGELTNDLRETQRRIERAFFVDLFQIVSSLDTVRSATEVLGRQEERMVLLGGVLERVEREVLAPAMRRIFGILSRAKALPADLPADDVHFEFVSILSIMMKAAGTANIERFLQMYAQMLGLDPGLAAAVNLEALLRDYAQKLAVPTRGLRGILEAEQIRQAQAQAQQMQQMAEVGKTLSEAGQNLAKSDVGGGLNALQVLTGGLGG